MNRFRFPTRILLSVVALGILTTLWAVRPSWQLGLLQTLLVLAAPACAVIAALQSVGLRKSFFIGVSIPAAISAVIFVEKLSYECVGSAWGFTDEEVNLAQGLTVVAPFFKLVLMFWATSPVVGVLGALTHWLLAGSPDSRGAAAAPRKDRRRWIQFSLRGFLILLSAFSVCLGVVAKRKQDEREAIKVIEAAGGRILYDWQSAEREPPTDDPTPSGPAWLRRLIGDDFFQAAEEVSVLRLAAPKEPTILNLIPSLRQLPCLKVVIVPPMSEEGRRELRAALPNCRLWSPGAAVP